MPLPERRRVIWGAMVLTAGGGLAVLALAITGATTTPRSVGLTPPGTVMEYVLPRPNAFPHDPAVGPDGIVWYTDQHNSYIGRLDPTTGKVTDVPTPTPNSGPHGIIVAPTGGVWYTANAAGRIGRLDPATNKIREFALPSEAGDPHTPLLVGGQLWFTVQQADLYGVLDTTTGRVVLHRIATPHALPYGIMQAPNGAIWIALFGTNALGQVNPATGEMKEVRLPDAGARPRRLAIDKTGRIWYSDYARGKLGTYDPASGKFAEYPCRTATARRPMASPSRLMAASGTRKVGTAGSSSSIRAPHRTRRTTFRRRARSFGTCRWIRLAPASGWPSVEPGALGGSTTSRRLRASDG